MQLRMKKKIDDAASDHKNPLSVFSEFQEYLIFLEHTHAILNTETGQKKK